MLSEYFIRVSGQLHFNRDDKIDNLYSHNFGLNEHDLFDTAFTLFCIMSEAIQAVIC